jgi:hypothetical protein
MTAANLRPSYSNGVSAYGQSERDVAIESETVMQTVAADAGKPFAEEPIPSRRVSHNGLVVIVGRGQSKQLQFDRRRRPLRAGPLHRPTTKATKYSLVTTS